MPGGWKPASQHPKAAPRTYAGYIPVGEADGRKMYEHYLFFDPWLMMDTSAAAVERQHAWDTSAAVVERQKMI